jgi:hypothetical protein
MTTGTESGLATECVEKLKLPVINHGELRNVGNKDIFVSSVDTLLIGLSKKRSSLNACSDGMCHQCANVPKSVGKSCLKMEKNGRYWKLL